MYNYCPFVKIWSPVAGDIALGGEQIVITLTQDQA